MSEQDGIIYDSQSTLLGNALQMSGKNALILYGLFNTFVTASSEHNWNS